MDKDEDDAGHTENGNEWNLICETTVDAFTEVGDDTGNGDCSDDDHGEESECHSSKIGRKNFDNVHLSGGDENTVGNTEENSRDKDTGDCSGANEDCGRCRTEKAGKLHIAATSAKVRSEPTLSNRSNDTTYDHQAGEQLLIGSCNVPSSGRKRSLVSENLEETNHGHESRSKTVIKTAISN